MNRKHATILHLQAVVEFIDGWTNPTVADVRQFVLDEILRVQTANDKPFILEARDHQYLALLAERGERGMTDDECDQITNWKHQTTSAIGSNLRRYGYIRFSGKTRRTRKGCSAGVNVLTEKGRKP